VDVVGDLDTFISGICDGLQAADQNVKKFAPVLQDAEDINPKMPILIKDDMNIVKIVATKAFRESLGYKISVEEV
jgi:hypothetical protein